MDLYEKLKEANKLKHEIDDATNFLNHIERSRSYYGGLDGKKNYPDSLRLSSYIYTGDDKHRNSFTLKEEDLIISFINAGVEVLQNKIDSKKTELKSLIK